MVPLENAIFSDRTLNGFKTSLSFVCKQKLYSKSSNYDIVFSIFPGIHWTKSVSVACCFTSYRNLQRKFQPNHIVPVSINVRTIKVFMPSTVSVMTTKLDPFSSNPSTVPMVMMTSSNENIFRVTGHLCGKFTGPRWIPLTKASDAERWCFLWSASE